MKKLNGKGKKDMFEPKNRCRTMEKMSEVEEQKVRWIWKPYLPFGKVSVVHGEPGAGKSIFAARLAAACTNRRYLPGMEELEPCRVLYLTADDDLSDMVRPRLAEAGADLDLVYAIHDMLPLTLSDDSIQQLIEEHNIRVLVVDPVQEYMERDVYGEKPEMVYPVINRLEKMARQTGCAVILVAYSDGPGGDGSLAWKENYAEKISSLLCLERTGGDKRRILHEKSLLSVEGEPLSFTLGDMEVIKELPGEKELPW